MELHLKLENLEKQIKDELNINIEKAIDTAIKESVSNQVNALAKDLIIEHVNETVTKYVNEYITTKTFKVGGGYYDDKPEEVLTVEQFIKRQIQDVMESQTLRSPNSTRKLTFAEFITQRFDANKLIADELEDFMEGVKKDVNLTLKNEFNEAMKQTLSSTVINVLNQNETYAKIKNNISLIANRD